MVSPRATGFGTGTGNEYNAVSERDYGAVSPDKRQCRDSDLEPRKRRACEPGERRRRDRRRRSRHAACVRSAHGADGAHSGRGSRAGGSARGRALRSGAERGRRRRGDGLRARRRRARAGDESVDPSQGRSAQVVFSQRSGRPDRHLAARRTECHGTAGLGALPTVATGPGARPVLSARAAGARRKRPRAHRGGEDQAPRTRSVVSGASITRSRRGRASRPPAPAAPPAVGCRSSSLSHSWQRCSTWPGVACSIESRRRRDTAAASRTTLASAPPASTHCLGRRPRELDTEGAPRE